MKDLVEEAREMNERSIRRNNKWNLIIIAVLFVGFIIYSLTGKGSAGAGFRFVDDGLIITDSQGVENSVNYDEMESVTFVETADFGEAAGGQITGVFIKHMEGTFRSEMFGEYTASCQTKIQSAIWIRTADASYVINTESDESTKALYEAILERIGK